MRAETEARPLLCALIGLAIGLTTGWVPWHAALIVPVVVWLPKARGRLLATAGLVVGVGLAPTPPESSTTESGFVSGTARVVSIPRVGERYRTADVELGGQIFRMRWDGHPDLAFGDRFTVRGVTRPFSEGSERRSILAGRTADLRPVPGGITEIAFGHPWYRFAGRWRDDILEFIRLNLPKTSADLVGALCLNVTEPLDPHTYRALQRTGTAHIVSVSGLHAVLFAVIVQVFLGFLPLPRPLLLFLSLLALALYATATGLQPPVVRATAMLALYWTAYLWQREPDGLSALAFAATAYLLVRPNEIFAVGFQLSFATVLYLVLAFGREGHRHETGAFGLLKAQVGRTLKASVVAAVASGPLVAYHFGILPLVSPFANLLIGFVLPFVIGGTIASQAVAWFARPISIGAMVAAVEPLSSWISFVVISLDALPGIAVPVPELSGYAVAALYAFAYVAYPNRPRPA